MKWVLQVGRLEDYRLQTLHAIVSFQKIYRGYKARCHFKKLRKTALFLQSCKRLLLEFNILCFTMRQWQWKPPTYCDLCDYVVVRSRKIQRLFEEMLKKHRAAVRIQKYVRGRAKRKRFLKTKKEIVLIQSGKAMLSVSNVLKKRVVEQ